MLQSNSPMDPPTNVRRYNRYMFFNKAKTTVQLYAYLAHSVISVKFEKLSNHQSVELFKNDVYVMCTTNKSIGLKMDDQLSLWTIVRTPIQISTSDLNLELKIPLKWHGGNNRKISQNKENTPNMRLDNLILFAESELWKTWSRYFVW